MAARPDSAQVNACLPTRTCPQCHTHRASLDRVALLTALGYLARVACATCIDGWRAGGAIVDYIGPA